MYVIVAAYVALANMAWLGLVPVTEDAVLVMVLTAHS